MRSAIRSVASSKSGFCGDLAIDIGLFHAVSKKPKPPRLFPEGYWDRPKPQSKGDPNDGRIFQAVGAALTAWEAAEETLARLCYIFSEIDDARAYTAIRQLFGTIESSSGRRKAIETLSELYFGSYKDDPAIKTPFNQLMTAFSAGSKLRDDIAHGKVTIFIIVSGDNQDCDQDCGAFLIPSEYNTGRTNPYIDASDQFPFNMKRAKYRYTSGDIIDILERFTRLNEVIINYIISICKIDGIIPSIQEKITKTHPTTSG